MRPNRVEVPPPAFDHDLSLPQRIEDFTIEQFVTQARIEALDIAVLPGATRCDVGGLCADRCDPLLHSLGHKFWPIVGPDVARHTAQDEEFGQHIDHIGGFELARNPDCQAFVGELIDHIEHAIPPSIVSAVFDEVIGPDVIPALGPQSNAGSVRQPKPAALGLLTGDVQPLTPPDPLNPLVVDDPACLFQQPGNLAIAIAAVLSGKLNDIGSEPFFVITAPRHLALRRAMLSERRTGAALGDMHDFYDLLDTGASARGA